MQGFGLQGAVVVEGWMGLGTSVVELITEDFAMRAWSRFLYA
jgi:hypothetical protein